ncbi:hypothetical protein Pcinc_011075 [Petrolisthes cinctipes]|uniref:Uncharacterized protein n=1 Tax=Petrolisthes cinctipes TaxID=88211 RepID=A0AAE1KSY5_PETCI|nr:hypothetical protein Pcinc_011075 [Petrolisthes cinctipes]
MEKDLELPSTSTGRRDIRGPPTVPSVTPGRPVRRRLDTSGDIRACLDDLDAYVSSDEDDITNDEFMVSREWASSSEEDVDDPLPLEEEEEEVVVSTPPPGKGKGKGKGKGRSVPKPVAPTSVAPAPVDLDDEDEEVELVAITPPARKKRRGGRAPPVPTPVAASTPIRGHRPAPPPASEPDPHNFQWEDVTEDNPYTPTTFPCDGRSAGLSGAVGDLPTTATYIDYFMCFFDVALMTLIADQTNQFYQFCGPRDSYPPRSPARVWTDTTKEEICQNYISRHFMELIPSDQRPNRRNVQRICVVCAHTKRRQRVRKRT